MNIYNKIKIMNDYLSQLIKRILIEEFENDNTKMPILEGRLIHEDEYGSVELINEAKYKGKKVTLNKPFYTPGGPKKRSVYVKNEKGNVVKVNFGDPNMKIKKSDPNRRKSFRARHNCQNPGPKTSARYWSCRAW
jgi:hypothetical protein